MNFYNTNGGSTLPPSPIGNVAMQNMQQTQQVPFVPVGGYYTNYNGYFNPWEIQRRQDEFIKAQNAAVENQINIQKRIIMNANETLGIQVDEAEVDKMFEQYKPKSQSSFEILQEQQNLQKQQQLFQAVNSNTHTGSIMADAYTKIFANAEKEMMDRYEGKSLEEQYQALNEIAFDQREEEIKKQNRNFRGSYSSNDYRSLVSNSTDPSRAVFTSNIDDMEISLPSGFSQEYQQKRAMFLTKLLGR